MKAVLQRLAQRLAPADAMPDAGEEFRELHGLCAPYSALSPERLFAVYQAADHVARARIAGDVVECGVWRGGAAMMMALTLQRRGDTRTVWLYDTFAGMTEPGEADQDYTGRAAAESWDSEGRTLRDDAVRCDASLEVVRANLASAGIDESRVRFVVGPVEETIPGVAPEQIALLRLDTDWYESTRHELEYLYPRLVSRGVLLIDDYGHWQGARKAVDEFFAASTAPPLLVRVDYTGRVAVKP
jgi:predicted O-methyltransferase YrrM